MFVYALIAAELALLYAVFWYLYLRDGRPARKMSACDWGRYDNTGTREQLPEVEQCDHCASRVKGFMIPRPGELVFDPVKRRYVTPGRNSQMRSRAASFLQQLDEFFTKLNVKP